MRDARPTRFMTFDCVEAGEHVVVCCSCGERFEAAYELESLERSVHLEERREARWKGWHVGPHTILDCDVRDYCAVV